MSKFLIKITPSIIFWGIFIFTILQIPYPTTLIQAESSQLLLFFIPLFLALTTTINLFLKNIFSSGSISLGLIFILVLKALASLNPVTTALTLIAVALFVSYFKKIKRSNLTKFSKIPKLSQLRKKRI